MATIYQLRVTSEDRKACADMARNLIQVYVHRQFIQSNIKRITEEWKSIARRIKSGEEMIEKILAVRGSQGFDQLYLNSLGDLYYLLVTLNSMYEGFFASAFPPEDEARRDKVQVILNDVREILCV
jgi:hypothetical protein